MNAAPKLSVCIPTYNRADRLDRLVTALTTQIEAGGLAHEVEVVISDNASSDGTNQLGEKWATRHPFIHYFRNAWNVGGECNFVKVIERAQGKFAWVVGDDDQVHADAIAHVLAQLTPGVTQLYLNFRSVNRAGQCLIPSRMDPELPDEITTLELVKRIGFVTGFALISSHVFDRERVLATDLRALLKISPFYVLNVALIEAFHTEPCRLVRRPVFDYTVGNERMAHETGLYVRVLGLLRTLRWLESNGKINEDFLFACREIGSNESTICHYLREEIYGNLVELTDFWALPGKADWQEIREFIERGPGFQAIRQRLQGYFSRDFERYQEHQKPIIHHWRGKAWRAALSILFSSDDDLECLGFNQMMAAWHDQFAHESILISRLEIKATPASHIDILMAPFAPHRSAAGALNSGFRKALGSHVLVLEKAEASLTEPLVKKVDEWQAQPDAARSRLIFASSRDGIPGDLIGLYLDRRELVLLGGFENNFADWPRHRLIADAALRLRSTTWSMDGAEISAAALRAWWKAQLPGWTRTLRALRRTPLSEHGLNITPRRNLQREGGL